MKKLFLYVFLGLLFCNVSLSDIRYIDSKITIAGISLGDKARDFFTLNELKDNQLFHSKYNNFVTSVFDREKIKLWKKLLSSDTYGSYFKFFDEIMIGYDDWDYIIHSIAGKKYQNHCLSDLDQIHDKIYENEKNIGRISKEDFFEYDDRGIKKRKLGIVYTKFYSFSDKVIYLSCYIYDRYRTGKTDELYMPEYKKSKSLLSVLIRTKEFDKKLKKY